MCAEGPFDMSKEGEAAFKKMFRIELQLEPRFNRGVSSIVHVKALEVGQSFELEAGYMCKDFCEGHYGARAYGIDIADLNEWRQRYNVRAGDLNKDKFIITPENVYQKADKQYKLHLHPLCATLLDVVTFMLRTGDFSLSTQFVKPSYGNSFKPAAAETLWNIYRQQALEASKVTVEQTSEVLYGRPAKAWYNWPMSSIIDSYDGNDDFKDQAVQAREMYDMANPSDSNEMLFEDRQYAPAGAPARTFQRWTGNRNHPHRAGGYDTDMGYDRHWDPAPAAANVAQHREVIINGNLQRRGRGSGGASANLVF